MQTLRRSRIQPAVEPVNMRSLPQLIRPPLPVRHEHLSTIELRIYQLLRVMFVLTPLVAGVDKFFYAITDWDRYVPSVLTSIHIQAHPVMVAAGVVEIVVALLVAFAPRIGSLALLAMLSGIMLDLLLIPRQLHILLLDVCLCVSVLCLFLLASKDHMLKRMR